MIALCNDVDQRSPHIRAPFASTNREDQRPLSTRTNEKFSDACGLRLLGLRTTLEVLKQLPVILEAKSVDEGD